MAFPDDPSDPVIGHSPQMQGGRWLATRLHDDVVQSMSAALMALGLARMDRPDDELLRDAEASLDRSAAAIRAIIEELGDDPLPPD